MNKKRFNMIKIFILFFTICFHLLLLMNRNLFSYLLVSGGLYALSYIWIRILFVIVDKQIKEKNIIDFIYLFCVFVGDISLVLMKYYKQFLFFSYFLLLGAFLFAQIYWVVAFIRESILKIKN